MSDFLESCTFLTDTQRQVLRDQDMDSPSAFKHVTLARLEAPPFGFTPGRASKLLDAAGAGGSSPMTVVHQNAEPVDVSVRIDRALQAEVEGRARGCPRRQLLLGEQRLDQVRGVERARQRAEHDRLGADCL